MVGMWTIALQLAASPAAKAPSPTEFDLAKLKPAERACGNAANGEIVVCGSTRDRYRLPAPGDAYAEAPIRAETRIGDLGVSAHGESANVGGFVSNRAMVTLKIPFGKGEPAK